MIKGHSCDLMLAHFVQYKVLIQITESLLAICTSSPILYIVYSKHLAMQLLVKPSSNNCMCEMLLSHWNPDL